MIEEGFDRIVELWTPILDVFKEYGIKFALEVHPSESLLIGRFADRKEFGLNFDPSHLLWQGVTPISS